jgi:hypothetical protein
MLPRAVDRPIQREVRRPDQHRLLVADVSEMTSSPICWQPAGAGVFKRYAVSDRFPWLEKVVFYSHAGYAASQRTG